MKQLRQVELVPLSINYMNDTVNSIGFDSFYREISRGHVRGHILRKINGYLFCRRFIPIYMDSEIDAAYDVVESLW